MDGFGWVTPHSAALSDSDCSSAASVAHRESFSVVRRHLRLSRAPRRRIYESMREKSAQMPDEGLQSSLKQNEDELAVLQ